MFEIVLMDDYENHCHYNEQYSDEYNSIELSRVQSYKSLNKAVINSSPKRVRVPKIFPGHGIVVRDKNEQKSYTPPLIDKSK